MAPQPFTADICDECGFALRLANNLDPMTAVRSEGMVISNGVYRPVRLIVVVMIWVIFLPWLLGSLLGMLTAISVTGAWGFMMFWFSVGNATLAATAMYKVTANYLKVHR